MSTLSVELSLPDYANSVLLSGDYRYRVLYGGRGGAKSWAVAIALLLLGVQKPIRVLCAREFQNSMRDSVQKLLADQINAIPYLSAFYTMQNNVIKGLNGTEFAFEGLRYNVTKIKSFEGVDICWIEEAQTVSKTSWEVLIPTIRKPGSEIWLTFNPDLDTDETYKRFVLTPPTNSIVKKVGWQDNPWFPDVLHQEMLDLKARDADSYLHVWEGFCRQALEGAIYARELRQAQEDNRIGRVPYEASRETHCFIDLGRADKTAIWFVQQVGFEYRVIDFYENRGYGWAHYIKLIKDRPYVMGTVYLPHDAQHVLLASDRTIEMQTRDAGLKAMIVPRSSVEAGIDAARQVFNKCWFDEERCADGLMALRHYRYDIDPDTGKVSSRPLHDDYSHAADAFRYFAVAMTEAPRNKPNRHSGGWMG
jgi:phage terminase large subunit